MFDIDLPSGHSPTELAVNSDGRLELFCIDAAGLIQSLLPEEVW